MRTLVNFEIKNSETRIVTTHIYKHHKTEQSSIISNESLRYCAGNFVSEGCVITIDVMKRGRKAADTFYAVIARLEEKFSIKSEFINGSYLGMAQKPILKVA